jgi:hypothetical protein
VPVLLPTPDELAAMDWHARERAISRARRLLSEYAQRWEPVERRYRMTEDERTASAERRAEYDRAWGESVRAEARRLAGEVAS